MPPPPPPLVPLNATLSLLCLDPLFQAVSRSFVSVFLWRLTALHRPLQHTETFRPKRRQRRGDLLCLASAGLLWMLSVVRWSKKVTLMCVEVVEKSGFAGRAQKYQQALHEYIWSLQEFAGFKKTCNIVRSWHFLSSWGTHIIAIPASVHHLVSRQATVSWWHSLWFLLTGCVCMGLCSCWSGPDSREPFPCLNEACSPSQGMLSPQSWRKLLLTV